MDLKQIKQFYVETWWLWTLYLVMTLLAIWFIHPIFISAIPIVGIISGYFAVVRGPNKPKEVVEEPEESVTRESVKKEGAEKES